MKKNTDRTSRKSARQSASRVLLVEDDDLLRECLRSVIQRKGPIFDREIECVGVATGDAAIVEMQREPAAVVVADHRLPGTILGMDLLHIVKRRWGSGLVLLTGYGSSAMYQDAAAIGARVLIKPVPNYDLLTVIENEISKFELRQAGGPNGN